MIDLTGKVFDKITVIGLSHKVRTGKCFKYLWKCKCECGKEFLRRGDSLRAKRGFKSCGCYRIEFSKKFFNENNPNKTHGLYKTRIYKIYSKMKERCYNENYPEFHLYGGRGIKVCDHWMNDFMNFYNWANENSYSDDKSIDRIDTNSDYTPENCRWADVYTQANNKRNNVILTHEGKTMTLANWARHLGLPYTTLANRKRRGKSVEDILYPFKK